jgi:hypothetical protein
LHIGEILVGKDLLSQLLDERRCPETMKAFPATSLAHGRMKMI